MTGVNNIQQDVNNDGGTTRRKTGAWRSLVAHCNGVAGVGGSNPLAPTCSKAEYTTKR